MLINYYGDSAVNPGTLNTRLGINACPLNWWAVPNSSSYVSGLDTTLDHPSTNSAISVMRNALQSGEPVVLGYQKSSNSEHYVLVKAVYNYGTQLSDFRCIDPLDGATYNLSTLVGSKAITRIACYYK